ncbi:MAG TPA: hypothetical protein VH165_24930 [Kofleriaceae bacterium]|nr:hypothetical protein [Kofleriaceae bacterium]
MLAVLPAVAVAAPKKPAKKSTKKPATPATDPAAPTPDATSEPASGDARAPDPAAASPAPASASAGDAAPSSPGGGDAAKPADGDKPAADGPDVDSLRQEYLSLRDELFKSRARANAVASQLYSTRIQVKLTYTTGRYYNPSKSSIRLDGANIYEDASGAIAGDDGIRFDGYVAPGRHLITFRVEATGKDDDSFTSTTESQVVVKAVAGKDLIVAAKAKDSGDIAYEWKRTETGSYGLGIDVAVKTAKTAETAPAPTPPPPAKAKGDKK